MQTTDLLITTTSASRLSARYEMASSNYLRMRTDKVQIVHLARLYCSYLASRYVRLDHRYATTIPGPRTQPYIGTMRQTSDNILQHLLCTRLWKQPKSLFARLSSPCVLNAAKLHQLASAQFRALFKFLNKHRIRTSTALVAVSKKTHYSLAEANHNA
jgi:hypothetical protein